MKIKHIIVILSLVLVSCSGDQNKSVEDIIATQDLEKIRQKKAELDAEQRGLAASIQQLEAEINYRDTLIHYVKKMGTSIALYPTTQRWHGDENVGYYDSLASAFVKRHIQSLSNGVVNMFRFGAFIDIG